MVISNDDVTDHGEISNISNNLRDEKARPEVDQQAAIDATGCGQLNEKVLLCFDQTRDWRQCQEEVTAFRHCMEQFTRRLAI